MKKKKEKKGNDSCKFRLGKEFEILYGEEETDRKWKRKTLGREREREKRIL